MAQVLDVEHDAWMLKPFGEDWDKTLAPLLGLTADMIESIKKNCVGRPDLQK